MQRFVHMSVVLVALALPTVVVAQQRPPGVSPNLRRMAQSVATHVGGFASGRYGVTLGRPMVLTQVRSGTTPRYALRPLSRTAAQRGEIVRPFSARLPQSSHNPGYGLSGVFRSVPGAKSRVQPMVMGRVGRDGTFALYNPYSRKPFGRPLGSK